MVGAEAVNESVGIMRIKGDFDSLILYPIDKIAGQLISIRMTIGLVMI